MHTKETLNMPRVRAIEEGLFPTENIIAPEVIEMEQRDRMLHTHAYA